jgi:uncharacterized protein
MVDILINKLAILFVRFYQKFISPITVGSCRYYPSCSEYAVWQFETNGFFRAFFASFSHILRCNKFFEGGIEYPKVSFVPPKFSLKKPNTNVVKIRYFFVPQKNGFVAIKEWKTKKA